MKSLAIIIALFMCGSAAGAFNLDDLKKQIAQEDGAIQAALAAADYDTAEGMYRKQLELLHANGAGNSALYASLLRAHAAVVKHQFNYALAQKEEDEAKRIDAEVASAVPRAPRAAASPSIPPPPAAAVKAAKFYAAKAAAKPVSRGLSCGAGDARYDVTTAIGHMDCHLMYDGKGLCRVLNEQDAKIQFAINYPSLKTRILADDAVNKGKSYKCDYWGCDAPPYIDEAGATASGAHALGTKTIEGHPCSGWSSIYNDGGLHLFLCEMWFAKDLRFPYQYSWAMQETPNKKVTWKLAAFDPKPRAFIFDLSGYTDSGKAWGGNPWLKWMFE